MNKNTFFLNPLRSLFTVFFIFLLSSSFAQTVYYANSATGNDSNAGTIGAPFKTFHKAYTVAVSGDILDLTGTFTWTDSDETGDVVRRGYVLDKNLTIQGQGAGVTIIQANSTENTADRMVFSGTTTGAFNRLTIKKLTIRNGVSTEDDNTSAGLLIKTTTTNYIFNLTISECSFEKNRINSFPSSNSFSGGALSFGGYAYGTLNIEKTTFKDNYAYVRSYGAGGIYINQGVNATLKECTFDNNIGRSNFSDTYYGTSGAIYAYRNNNVIITNSTFVNNQSDGTAGAILSTQNNVILTNNTIVSNIVTSATGIVGGVYLDQISSAYIKNNIIANNLANGVSKDFHVSSGSIISNGYNIVESSSGFTFNSTGDITGNQVNLFGTGISSTPSLDNNGTLFGTKTIALSVGSVAINNGNSSPNSTVQVPLTDQRGLARGCVVDIGAFDYANNEATISGVQNMAVGGSTLQLTGSGTPASVTPWVSSNPTAATISATGVVAAANTGTTTITYTTAEGCSVSAIINILNCASPFGNAMSFDGTNDYVTVGDNFENLADVTAEAWVYWRGSTNAFSEIFTKDLVSSFAITSTNKLHANFGNGSTWDSGLNSSASIPLNTWTHLVVTRQSGVVKLYINGIQDASTATLNFTGQNTSHRAIGAKLLGTSLYSDSAFNGIIDELRLWSSVRTLSQIQSSMNRELTGTETGLLAYYNFNHGVAAGNNSSVTTVVNIVNSASNGTITNSAKSGSTSNFVVGVTSNFPITGSSTICANSTSQYTHPIAGGSWSVSNSATATINSSTGLLTTTAGETLTISYSYTMNGCSYTDTKSVTIQLPVISGLSITGIGDQMTLTATTTPANSNVWVSSNTAIASISNTGVVTGLSPGSTTITYTNASGCTATQVITVVVGTTQPPVLTSPVSNTTGVTTLNINYSLPENPLAGSVRLTFTPTAGGTPIVWTMTNATSVSFSYAVGTNPAAANPNNVLTGAALPFGSYNLTLSYQDAFGNPVAQVTNTNIQTLASPSISFASTTQAAVVNRAISIATINSGGAATFTIAPALPTVVVLNSSTGLISGTPTAIMASRLYTVTATNAAGSGSATFTLFIDSDLDGDGIGDATDPDTDGDVVPNTVEIQEGTSPTNPNDYKDSDGDGVPDYVEVQQNTDPNDPNDARDTDGDGVPDYVEILQGTNPNTPGDQLIDSDGDGVPDYVETRQGTNPTVPGDAKDTDGDGVPDYVEIRQGTNPNVQNILVVDTDGDGVLDAVDTDDDGDTILDINDAFPLDKNEWKDSDRDGRGDNADTDDDNDGILDVCDVDVNGDRIPDNGTDMDRDGIIDSCDPDRDGDGVNNTTDNCPDLPNTDQADRDRDGLGNVCDTIVLNAAQTFTPNGDGINDTWVVYNLENHPGSIVRVFNSNGKQVFYSANYKNDWNGNYQGSGEMLPIGSYLYQIDLDGDGSIDEQAWLYITK